MAANNRQPIEPSRSRATNRLPTGERSAAARLVLFLTPTRKGGGLQVVDGTGRVMDVPAKMTDVIRRAAELMAAGQTVTVLAEDKFLTTQQAAAVLNVSRQYVVRLIESGQLPAVKVGAHRRLQPSEVEAFKARRDAQRTSALDTLAALTEDAGGYDLPVTAR